MEDHDSLELLVRLKGGDESAASLVYAEFAARLIGLVRMHLAEKFQRRFDAEDVVQSAFRSFFAGTREGRFLLQHSGNIWSLLVSIALHKLQHNVARHRAAKRAIHREYRGNFDSVPLQEFQVKTDSSPSTEEAISLAEEIEEILSLLSPIEQRMFELRLEGYTLEEIASDVHRSQRTVRRLMERIREHISRKQEAYLS